MFIPECVGLVGLLHNLDDENIDGAHDLGSVLEVVETLVEQQGEQVVDELLQHVLARMAGQRRHLEQLYTHRGHYTMAG